MKIDVEMDAEFTIEVLCIQRVHTICRAEILLLGDASDQLAICLSRNIDGNVAQLAVEYFC